MDFNEIILNVSSQDSSVGSTLGQYSEGPGFKSRCILQLNFQLEKSWGSDSIQYAIKYGCVKSNLNTTSLQQTIGTKSMQNSISISLTNKTLPRAGTQTILSSHRRLTLKSPWRNNKTLKRKNDSIQCSVRGYMHAVYCKAAYK